MALTYINSLKTTRITAVLTAIDAGVSFAKCRIYEGAVPADVNTALAAQQVIVDVLFNDPAGSVTGSVLTFDNAPNPTGVASLAGSNVATFFRITDSDDNAVIQGTVGQGSGDLSLDNTTIDQNDTVNITSWTITTGN
jgi:hypothetical protein